MVLALLILVRHEGNADSFVLWAILFTLMARELEGK